MSITAGLHATVDELAMLLGTLLQPGRGFSQTRDTAAATHRELYESCRQTPPEIDWERARQRPGLGPWPSWSSVPVHAPGEGVDTQIDLAIDPAGRHDVLIVYHHGLRESNHTLLPSLLRLQPELRGRA
ncbi:MAG: hypothetical protein D6776_10025, partial [Planctomycetota bacterium]